MSVSPLTGPHIQAPGYRRGRSRMHAGRVIWLALHTTEGIRDEVDLGAFWRDRTTASSHAGVGRDGGYATYVRYEDTAWTNPDVHDDTETLEICAMAGWSRSEWLRYPAMLETIAHWIAWRSEVRDIPIVRREGDAIRSWTPGIVDHDGINDVRRRSSHWDVGENFPWDIVLPRATAIRGGGGGTVEDSMSAAEVEDLKRTINEAMTNAVQGVWRFPVGNPLDPKGGTTNMAALGRVAADHSVRASTAAEGTAEEVWAQEVDNPLTGPEDTRPTNPMSLLRVAADHSFKASRGIAVIIGLLEEIRDSLAAAAKPPAEPPVEPPTEPAPAVADEGKGPGGGG